MEGTSAKLAIEIAPETTNVINRCCMHQWRNRPVESRDPAVEEAQYGVALGIFLSREQQTRQPGHDR